MNINNDLSDYYFSGHEQLFNRVGVFSQKEDITPMDVLRAMKEIENVYKQKYGYTCVKVIRNKNDPLLVDVYVVPNKRY